MSSKQTKKDCHINPLTGRAIKTSGVTYKKLMEKEKKATTIQASIKSKNAQNDLNEKKEAVNKLKAVVKRTTTKKPDPPKPSSKTNDHVNIGKDKSPPYPKGKYKKDFMEIEYMKPKGGYVSYNFGKLDNKKKLEKYVKENGYKYTFSNRKKQFEAKEGIFRDFNFASIEVYDDIVEFSYEGTDYYIFKSTDEPVYKPKFKDISDKLGMFADREVFDVYTLVDLNRNKIHWSVLIFDKSQAGQKLSEQRLKKFDKNEMIKN